MNSSLLIKLYAWQCNKMPRASFKVTIANISKAKLYFAFDKSETLPIEKNFMN